MRNEEKNIGSLLSDICKQSYPAEMFEVIVVDDQSTDSSAEIVKRFIDKHPLNSIKLVCHDKNAGYPSKKEALLHGVSNAKAAVCMMTDSDCRLPEKWIESMVYCYQTHNYLMLAGPVVLSPQKSFLHSFQALDYMSLNFCSMSSGNAGKPLMCSGANLLVSKKVYQECNVYQKDNFSSGDDMFLMQAVVKKYGSASVGFVKSLNALVKSYTEPGLTAFFRQRIRWLSKKGGYKLSWVKTVALIVFFANISLVAGYFSLFFPISRNVYVFLFLSALFLKSLTDSIILKKSIHYYGMPFLKAYIIPSVFIYPFYALSVVFANIFLKPLWKGRKIR